MVFQSYAIWPHMTVRRNIAYPLKARRITATSKGWVEQAAALVECDHLLDRYPSQLSGGQQQRVALARGLVARPDVVLFDEPLSNLDARLRDQVRSQLHELHARLRFTAVFVTHDQAEALALADRLAIMRQGRFEQVGRPEDIFAAPATEYVAEFIGMSNRFRVRSEASMLEIEGVEVDRAQEVVAHPGEFVGRVRPEDLVVLPSDKQRSPCQLAVRATVVDSQFGGRHCDVVVTVGDVRLQARVDTDEGDGWARRLRTDQRVVVAFTPGSATYFDGTGRRIDNENVVHRAERKSTATT
jgi:iron(III) transport system ATP-binding protein